MTRRKLLEGYAEMLCERCHAEIHATRPWRRFCNECCKKAAKYERQQAEMMGLIYKIPPDDAPHL